MAFVFSGELFVKHLLVYDYQADWEIDGSVGQVLVAQREDLSSIPRTCIKMPGTVACACHSSAGETETNGPLGIASYPA